MSPTDTSQSSSGFLKSQRTTGESELNSWTQGLGGAPRPNPIAPPTVSAQSYPSSSNTPQSNHGSAAAAPRYSNSNLRYDPKSSPPFHPHSPNPFLSSPSLGVGTGTEVRPEGRSPVREAWSQTQTSEAQDFDLSSYSHSETRPSAFSTSKDFSSKLTDPSFAHQGFNDWGHQSGAGAQDKNSLQAGFNLQATTEPMTNSGDYDDYETEGMTGTDEPRFANKKILLSFVLVGALIFGGGISYFYNSFFGDKGDTSTPIVKNAQGPSKVKPIDPGGKQFAHSESKILGRLDDTAATSQTDQSVDQSTGSRKVSTLVVGRDGSIQPNSPSETPSTPPSVTVPVPGLTLIDGSSSAPKSTAVSSSEGRGAPTGTSSPSQSKEEVVSVEVAPKTDANTIETVSKNEPNKVSSPAQASKFSKENSPPSSTEVAGESNLSASSASTRTAETSPNVAPEGRVSSSTDAPSKSTLRDSDISDPSQKMVSSSTSYVDTVKPSSGAKKKSEVKTAAIDPSSPPPRSTSIQPSGLGYVAVLASVPVSGASRMTALQKYADLQQKYNGILQNKIPEVQEANLGAKGRYHRLIIGPPGSKEAATSICSQLKSAGYSECWIMAF